MTKTNDSIESAFADQLIDWKDNNLKFDKFLYQVEEANFETNTTSTGTITIQQTPRNQLRKEGLEALKHDLELLYGDQFDIVETKEGLIIVAENFPGDWLFSWEIKTTIKSIDFDPYVEAQNYIDERNFKAEKKANREKEKLAKQQRLEEKRAKKALEIEQQLRNAK